MSWHELSANWNAFQMPLSRRFPHFDSARYPEAPRDRSALTRALAESHDLTLNEAHEALEVFLEAELGVQPD